MKVHVDGLKSKTIILAQRYVPNDVISLMVVVKAETSSIDFIVETVSDKVSKTFNDLNEAIQFYETI